MIKKFIHPVTQQSVDVTLEQGSKKLTIFSTKREQFLTTTLNFDVDFGCTTCAENAFKAFNKMAAKICVDRPESLHTWFELNMEGHN